MRVRALLVVISGLLIAADAKDDAVKKEKARLKGTWDIVSVEQEGRKVARPEGTKMKMVFQDDKFVMQSIMGDKKESKEATYTIDPTQKPVTIDIVPGEGPDKGKTVAGIYVIDKDELKICTVFKPGQDRPKEISAKEKTVLFTLKREKP